MTRSALQVGLEVFSSSAILSADKNFLGTLEIYGCDARRPKIMQSSFRMRGNGAPREISSRI
jgi:hypothetical protein